jgi:hypothetical protein
MAAERSYPRDACGNELRKGDLLRVSLQSPALNFRVVQVNPAGVIAAPGGGMPLRGTMVLVATMPVDFDADTMLVGMFKLCDPSPELAQEVREGAGTTLVTKQ